jgi:hypothetical protein
MGRTKVSLIMPFTFADEGRYQSLEETKQVLLDILDIINWISQQS